MREGLYSLDRLLFVLPLQTLQNHYHPEVAKAAAVLSRPLAELEDDISGLLELSAYEVGWGALGAAGKEPGCWAPQLCQPCCWGNAARPSGTQGKREDVH